MTRTLMAIAAVGGLTLSTAMAQAPSTMPDKSPSPSTSQSGGAMGASTANPGSQAISQQSPDQLLFSKFKGTDVVGTDEAKIGDVSDVLFDKTGKVHALIVGVGGFLGIGQKDVALPITVFEVVADKNGGSDKLRLSMTKEQLNQTAAFTPMKPATTTGSAPANGRPASPMSPPTSR